MAAVAVSTTGARRIRTDSADIDQDDSLVDGKSIKGGVPGGKENQIAKWCSKKAGTVGVDAARASRRTPAKVSGDYRDSIAENQQMVSTWHPASPSYHLRPSQSHRYAQAFFMGIMSAWERSLRVTGPAGRMTTGGGLLGWVRLEWEDVTD